MKPFGGAVIANHTFKTAAVRDLAWACFSPALISCDLLPEPVSAVANCGLALTRARRDWLADLDKEPARLHSYLAANTNHRLGIYFERLWHFFLNEDPAVDVVAVNLPVREAGQTLGEFDVIYFCKTRLRHVHLELAVKFFMGLPSAGLPSAGLTSAVLPRTTPSHWDQWLGPNTRDRLDLKLNHMLGRQIRLGEQPAAAELLSSLGVTELTRELEIKGYLFQAKNRPLAGPIAYNNQRTLCSWVSVTELNREPGLLRGSKFLPLQRLQWLAPVAADAERPGLTSAELLSHLGQHFADNNDALLVAQLDSGGAEIDRIFIAPEQWPHPPDIDKAKH